MAEQKNITDNKDLEKIESHIRLSLIVGGVLIIVVLGSYFINFHKSVSNSNEVWGTFGDFVGGTLNPILAALAFYWLTASIRLQLKELKDTRKVLEDTALHQQKLAELENINVTIQNRIFELQQLNLNKQLDAAKDQQQQISLQNFENIFFQLLKTKKENIDSIYYEYPSIREEKVFIGQNAIKQLTQKLQYQSDSISTYYNQELSEHFSSYFRIIYEIIKTCDDFINITENINHFKYINILGATLIINELKILFFYCLVDKEFKKIAEKFSLFKSLSIDNTNMNENWEVNHMLTSHAYEFSPQAFGTNEQWINYFKNIEKISLKLDPDKITKRLDLIYKFKLHINRYSGHSAAYRFETLDKINNNIQERILTIKNKNLDFSQKIQNEKISEDDAEKMTDYLEDMQLLQQLNSIEIDESLYYLLIYRIDYKYFLNHHHKN